MAWKFRRDPHDQTGGVSSEVPFSVQGKVGRIEDPPSAAFFKKYVQGNRPVVISGAMEGWPALERWSWDYLAAVAGDCTGEVVVSRNGLYPDYVTQPSPMAKVDMRFAEFLRRVVPAAGEAPLPPILEPGETYYLYGKSYLLDAVPALRADLRKPACLGAVAEPFQRLWISAPGCVTPLHYDLSNGLLCQVRGTKQVWLFDPAQFDRLYPRGSQFPGLDNFERQSQVDIHHPDYAAFPELRRASALECHLRQGDTLFIPSNWWHEVETLEPALSVQLAFAGGTVTSELAVLSDLFKTKKPADLMNDPAVQRLLQDPTMMQAVLRMMTDAAR
ncbi:MAG TPA: cupin-like domain-containing protein [Thermoanaerobaculia bacterium]|jgi:lysine-specific demethylase 8